MKRKYIIAVVVAASTVAFDQFTKHLVRSKMSMNENIPIIKDFFSLHHLTNPGAAFGLFRDMHALFFLGISVLALGMIAYYLVTAEDHKVFFPVCLALVLGGAIGNVTDRLVFGEVTDFLLLEAAFMGDAAVHFLDKYAGSHYWPSFNVADSSIVVGIFGMAIDLLFFTSPKKTAATDEPENA